MRHDLHPDPFRTMVALGESHVAGASASSEERRWVNVTARLLGEFQGTPVALHNKGIGANAISPRSPGYPTSAKPSALERYRQDVIPLEPDLFILSYGLNDMRAGMPPEDFRQDMKQIIEDVRQACNPVMVLTTVYYMTAYDLYPPYDVGSIAASEVYNLVIRQLAREQGCILADIWEAEGRADWAIHPDTVHANDLGHALIGHRVFEAIATRCSGVAKAVTESLAEARQEVERTMEQRRQPQDYGRR
ncbi:MAG: SGNH/GDSL hydrolase family protein [Anaerolineae bacterium]|nr:SGNH/GDSL hydrolase family protein [Anaerolineae bacterium]